MGRRKIEIKAIKDDRNRSVTFLKRKGGLFKKAHELSVLCQVEVAVVIFGHNKKLYEFSSHDINETVGKFQYVRAHYGGAHEHKGPDDFLGKKEAGSDDEDEEPASPRPDSHSPPQHAMIAHLQNQPAFQHMGTPHASPPMPNGAFHPRGPSPQPQNPSRPGSRAHIRHPSQSLVPPHMQVSQAQQAQQNYAYMPNPPIYNPQNAAVMGPQPGQQGPPQIRFSGPPPPQHPQQVAPMHPQQHPQMQQVYQQEQQRRQSMPPTFPQHPEHRPQQPAVPSPQPQQQQQQQQQQHQFGSPPMPQPKPLSTPAKTHSIFTPIDDSRSLLAQHWGSTTSAETSKPEPAAKAEMGPRSQSIDVGTVNRTQVNGVSHPTAQPPAVAATSQPTHAQRTASTPVFSSIPPHPPSRTNSLQTNRPRLRVEIPSENSDDEASKQTAATSPNPAGTALTPNREQGHNGVVLPPPSPSASTLLSAGASGPPNPFARPPPPPSVNGYPNGSRSDIETPISALPSRFMDQQLLSSPGGFYNWDNFNRDNMLPSPLQFQTPVVTNGPGFSDETDKKRKISDGSEGYGQEKRIRT